MQWGGLLSLKETEINISALEDTFPVMEATNLTLAFIPMLAFTVTFTLIAYQEIFSPVLMTLTKPAPGFQSSKLLNAHRWHYSVTNVKCLACIAGKFEDRSRYFACRVSCSRGNCSFFCCKLKGGEKGRWQCEIKVIDFVIGLMKLLIPSVLQQSAVLPHTQLTSGSHLKCRLKSKKGGKNPSVAVVRNTITASSCNHPVWHRAPAMIRARKHPSLHYRLA